MATALSVVSTSPKGSSIAHAIQKKVLEDYDRASWARKFTYFIFALISFKSVNTCLQGMVEKELHSFYRYIGSVRRALGDGQGRIAFNLHDGSRFEMEFYTCHANGHDVPVDDNITETEEFLRIRNSTRDDWITCPVSKSKLLELIDAAIEGNSEPSATSSKLIAACKLEQLYRVVAGSYSEFNTDGELKEESEFFDHVRQSSTTDFSRHIEEIQKNLIETGAYTKNVCSYMGSLQQKHQTRLFGAVTNFLFTQIDLIVSGEITQQNINDVLKALKIISDYRYVTHDFTPQLTVRIRLIQSHYGQIDVAKIPVKIGQKSLLDSIFYQVEKEGKSIKNIEKYKVATLLWLEAVVKKVLAYGLTENNEAEFDYAKGLIYSLPDNATTERLKSLLSQCHESIAEARHRASLS